MGYVRSTQHTMLRTTECARREHRTTAKHVAAATSGKQRHVQSAHRVREKHRESYATQYAGRNKPATHTHADTPLQSNAPSER